MKYKISEKDFFYVPENDERYTIENDGVIWTHEEVKEVNSLKKVLETAIAFTDIWPSVHPYDLALGEGTILYMFSNWDSDMDTNHPEHYYTNRHLLDVTIEQ